MNTFQIVIVLVLLSDLLIGLIVYFSNRKRPLNVGFLFLTLQIAIWLAFMFMCSIQHSDAIRLLFVRLTSAAGALLPLGVILIATSVRFPGISVMMLIFRLRYWLLALAGVIALCFSPVFAIYAGPLTENEPVPPTDYGWGFAVFNLYFLVVSAFMIGGYLKARRQLAGVQKEEMSFLLMGGSVGLIVGVSILVIAELVGEQRISGLLPLSVLVLICTIAYGIATRRILSASVVIQKAVSYGLLVLYLATLYLLTYTLLSHLLILVLKDTAFLAHMISAVMMAFSISPAHGRLQAFAYSLFPSRAPVNSDVVLKQARGLFQEIATDQRLAEGFAQLVSTTFDTPSVTILRSDANGHFCQIHPSVPATTASLIASGSPIMELLNNEAEPVTLDMLDRMPSTAITMSCRGLLEAYAAVAIAGCFLRNQMQALVLLSARRNHGIYDRNDQRVLQLLCDQFAVALENSSLYTAVQNARIYNDILLNSLTSGIVAVDISGIITVFNARAEQIAGCRSASITGQSVDRLPQPLAEALCELLASENPFRDRDLIISVATQEIPLRASGTRFHSHTGQLLGALVIFTDLTELKQMEAQIRRSDRLSSIGTLSAGMAHEIKNPLVTIKTFTQLLPEQYRDNEFRQTFFDLVGQEVKRIDTIVNRLLNFARPANAIMRPVSLHDVIDGSLQLIAQQLARNGIVLERHLNTVRHMVSADANQLNQAFINFLLNAVHAMPDGGTLTVRTSQISPTPDVPQFGGLRNGGYIQLDIEDTGCGIPAENLDRIFDPFFTTKEHGVGLGLSVSHGILDEHKAIVHVESEPGRGTVFHIQFPLQVSSLAEVI